MAFPNVLFGPAGEEYSTYANDERHRAGHRKGFMDGSVFVFGKAGGANIAASRLCQSTVPVTFHLGLTPSVAVVGAQQVTVTLGATAVAADDYKDGKLVVEAGTGAGYEYKIATHPAALASAALTVTLHPDEKLRTALDATSKISLMRNPLRDVVIAPASANPTAPFVGVSRAAIVAANHGWFQVKGDGPCLQQGALTVGLPASNSATVAGAIRDVPAQDAGVVSVQVGITARNAGDTNIGALRLNIPGW